MSIVKANYYLDAAGGNTAQINGIIPIGNGLVFLGTIFTTSGQVQTLSGLDLTPYNKLILEFDDVGKNGPSSDLSLGAGVILTNMTGPDTASGMVTVSLWSGIACPVLTWFNGLPRQLSSNLQIAQTGYTTATTSVSVSITTGPWDSGSIRVYGGQ